MSQLKTKTSNFNLNSKNIKKNIILFILIIFILFSLTIFTKIFLENTNFESPTSILYHVGMFFGATGFISLCLLIISGETARYFDRFFGIDRIIKIQRKFSLIVALFVITHPLFFIISNTSMVNYLIPDFSLIPFAMGAIAFYLFLIILIASILYKAISNTIWQILHIIIYILFIVALFHAINAGSSFQNNFTVRVLFLILIGAFIMGIIYRTQYKIKTLIRPKFKIEGVREETQDTFTLILTKPQNFKYDSGQFCFLKINKNKLYARHPFTISSAPSQDVLEFTIKDTGKFTSVARTMNNGDSIKIEGPFGTFIPDKEKELIMVAGGVGVTPFYSIIKDRTYNKSKQKMMLFYCSKTENDIIFKKELDALEQKNKNLKIIHFLSREQKDGFETRLNEENFNKYFKNKNKYFDLKENDLENIEIMMCGPQELKDSIENILKNQGISTNKIKEESFFW